MEIETNTMQQIETQIQIQEQLQKKDGSGAGMKDLLQSTLEELPQDTQDTIYDELSSLNQLDRRDMAEQITQLDSSNMSVEELQTTVLDMFDIQAPSNTIRSGQNDEATAAAIGATFVTYADKKKPC